MDLNAANEVQARYRSVRAIEILEQMEASGAKLQMLVLDACRDNPFGSGRSIGNKGLAPMNAGRGSFVAYATGPGRTADDNRQGQNGLYTSYLMEALKEPDLKLEEVFKRAGARVQQASNGKQIPWTASSVQGDFYFRPPQTETVSPTSSVSQTGTPDLQFQAEIAFWSAVDRDSTESLQLYLEKYPKGQFAELARLNLARIQKQSPSGGTGARQGQQQMALASIPSLPPGARQPTGELKSVINGVEFEFVHVSPGTFTMGSDQGDNDEKPPHHVTISRGVQMGKYEVTQGQWQAVMGSNPSGFTNCGLDCPVEQVSWFDVEQFLGRVNGQGDGHVYRLPTEAEWEYAAGAGITGDYGGSGTVDEMGWHNGNSASKTHPVGHKKPNGWGLYDMHGNVWEWVADRYDGNYYRNSPATDPQGPNRGTLRVMRGGSWSHNARVLRSTGRDGNDPGLRYTYYGFRLVRLAARASP